MTEVRAYSKSLSNENVEVVKKSITRLAAAVFAESQNNVPISSGYLKDSGKFFTRGNSIIMHYTAPYASDIESGRAGLGGGYVAPSLRGRTFGRKKPRVYREGYRPVPVGVKYDEEAPDNAWRVLDLSADLEPRNFIKNAFIKIFGDGRRKGSLTQLNENMIPKNMQ